ncbi:SDR family oxidoreductase [Telluribacter humicola]|uniref:SDR family oxidoreductase n=1 Tax=Telluribacter humicola TaxID=1720261 RepID=UPI001A95FEB2|nr:SDR family oxidoreductase [Telluribacter humicola]
MKNILITGTSSGLGLAMMNHLTQAGYRVIGTSRSPKESTGPGKTIRMDVRDEDSVREGLAKFLEMAGRIDVLINNAGCGIAGPIEETSLEEAREQFETNFFGLVRVTQAVLPHMRAQGGGLILNISSMGGLIGLPFQGFYSASKFALEGFTEALRIETRPFNISVVNINPGDFRSDFTANRKVVAKLSDTYRKRFEAAMQVYEQDEQMGADPHQVALLAEQLIRKQEGHKVRYLVGKRMQKIGTLVKKHTGSRFFEKILIDTYKQS